MSVGRPLSRGPLGALARRRSRRVRTGAPPRRPGLPRLSVRAALGRRRVRLALVALIAIGGLLFGGWLWLRNSSLVSVTRVRVTGVSGPDAGQIRGALVGAAHGMTTLNVDMAQLRTAVAPFPVVAGLRVTTQFPHGMRIRVIERPPVAVVTFAGRSVPVAGDGTLIHDMAANASLPVVPLTVPPGGPRVTGRALQVVQLLAAAPAPLLARVAQVTAVTGHGLVAQLRGGPSVYFGDASSARAKWLAAAAVLADPGSAGAAYIDVTDPVRPAAGAGAPSGSAGSNGSASSSSTGSGASAGG
jgi:cell division protein FtsQ